ncbi:MAG: hypothetical protein ACPGSM_00275 [Thiolinea sp.]
MWPRLLLISCLSLFTANLYAESNPEAVQIQLSQKPDTNCDGIPEPNERFTPGTCIIYEVEALNTGDIEYNNILVSTQIPEHTILMQTYSHAHNDEPVDSTIEQNHNSVRLLKTRLEKLQPGQSNKITLQYSVRIL